MIQFDCEIYFIEKDNVLSKYGVRIKVDTCFLNSRQKIRNKNIDLTI